MKTKDLTYEIINCAYEVQLLTYLKLLDLHVGLLINFNVSMLREGITRIVNNYEDKYFSKRQRNTQKISASLREIIIYFFLHLPRKKTLNYYY